MLKVREHTICEQIIFLALRLRQQTVPLWLLMGALPTDEAPKDGAVSLVDVHGLTFLTQWVSCLVQKQRCQEPIFISISGTWLFEHCKLTRFSALHSSLSLSLFLFLPPFLIYFIPFIQQKPSLRVHHLRQVIFKVRPQPRVPLQLLLRRPRRPSGSRSIQRPLFARIQFTLSNLGSFLFSLGRFR